MRIWQKIIVSIVAIMLLALVVLRFNSHAPAPVPEGSVPADDIVSYCIGHAVNDESLELLAISGKGQIDTGERHGRFLLVCDISAEADIKKPGYIPPDKIHYRIDIEEKKPLKVQLGDINGDGVNEVAICVYKTAKFHPIMAKRPFFFDLVDGNLIPVWLGSRLSRPFDDYILYDIDDDNIDEIISIEQLENGNRAIAVYNWSGFGFEMFTQSEEFGGNLSFNIDGKTSETGEVSVVFSAQRNKNTEQTELKISLNDDRLICK